MSLSESLGILAIGVFLIILAATTGIIFDQLTGAISGSADISQVAKDNAQEASENWGGAMDWILLCMLIGMPLISMGLAYFNDVPPFFFYTTIGTSLVMVFIGWALQDGLIEILNNGGIIGSYILSQMPKTAYLMQNWGVYSVIVILLIGIGTYVKQRGGAGYGSPY